MPSSTRLPEPSGESSTLPLALVELNTFPSRRKLSTLKTSILLLESTTTAPPASNVPGVAAVNLYKTYHQ